MRYSVLAILMILIFFNINSPMVSTAETNKVPLSSNSFQVNYHVILSKDNRPKIQVIVTNAPSKEMIFEIRTYGSFLGRLKNLNEIFNVCNVKSFKGVHLNWSWIDVNKIRIINGPYREFVIDYTVNTSSLTCLSFKDSRIFFIAGDIFFLPENRPSKITVNFTLPSKIMMFSSLPEKEGRFVATLDLWGNIIYDFQKAYFIGGRPIFYLNYRTEWGDKYIYIWFYKDTINQMWLPSYGNTPWENAKKYMKITAMFAEYYRKIIGPLPNHTVLFTNVINKDGVSVNNVDWFHYMQVWPRYSEPEIAHHLFHQYSFWTSQSKLSFNFGEPIGSFLSEGIPTYYEQLLPALLLNDSHYFGKIFEFFVLNERGKRFGIRSNTYHIKYNIATLKVYLLDQYIREKTNNVKNVNTFVRELWNYVRNNRKPRSISDSEVINVFKNVVNDMKDTYILDLAYKKDFDTKDFIQLLPYFKNYVTWMANKYFWGNKLLFLCFLDIVAAKGKEWPHYATYPHNILRYRREALTPFKEYLTKLSGANFTKEDIINALNYVTGRDHSGFFKFWSALSIELNPNSIKPLSRWDPNEITEDDLVTVPWEYVGSLKTEHYLAGIPQKAEAVLDYSDDDGEIAIEVQAISFKRYLTDNEASKILSGTSVSLLRLVRYTYRNLFITSAFFKVKTHDKNHKAFSFFLTLLPPAFYLKFRVYNNPTNLKKSIGSLYWISSIKPIRFNINVIDDNITLPDTLLENESYIIKYHDTELRCKPKYTINISNLLLKTTISTSKLRSMSMKIMLFDELGFLRGIKYVPVIDLAKHVPTLSKLLLLNNLVLNDRFKII